MLMQREHVCEGHKEGDPPGTAGAPSEMLHQAVEGDDADEADDDDDPPAAADVDKKVEDMSEEAKELGLASVEKQKEWLWR